MDHSRITAVQPRKAVEGGRISILGAGFAVDGPRLPQIHIGDRAARIVSASATRLDAIVPTGFSQSGSFGIRIDGENSDAAVLDVATPCASDLHQVDNPVCDRDGNLYVTFSGRRGQQVPVSIFRIRPDGSREPFSEGVVNPTSLAIDPEGQLYVSSRFEGVVYRLAADGSAEPFATDLGVACGLAFAPDGTLFVGDRSGTIFKVDHEGRATPFATLPPSVAAFHLALGPDRALYVTGPTLATYDAVYRVGVDGSVTIRSRAFGRPQGLAFDAQGTLFVVEALAGASGVYRVPEQGEPELVVAGPDLIGLTFDRQNDLVVCSPDNVYRLPQSVASRSRRRATAPTQ
jgi:sugar lactone lactonase YvrE